VTVDVNVEPTGNSFWVGNMFHLFWLLSVWLALKLISNVSLMVIALS